MSQANAKITIEPRVPQAAVRALESVVDPEIPVLTIRDLGILRGVRMDGETLVVTITPTYLGCPAMVEIRDSIYKVLVDAGIADFRVETNLSPAWTTDWMSEEGREKLRKYGIAPPQRVGPGQAYSASRDDGEGSNEPSSSRKHGDEVGMLSGTHFPVACPHCGSEDTRMISAFGSTPCKALHQCNACQEPFDHFKCH